MADFISISVTGLTGLRVDLARALTRLDKPRDLMATLGAVLEANIERRFDRKVDPTGTPWAPLAESTKKAYAAQDKGARRGTLILSLVDGLEHIGLIETGCPVATTLDGTTDIAGQMDDDSVVTHYGAGSRIEIAARTSHQFDAAVEIQRFFAGTGQEHGRTIPLADSVPARYTGVA